MNCALEIALANYGTKEVVGIRHNEKVLEYFRESGHSWVKDDETAWCSAFANYCALLAGYKTSGKLDARSWLKVGKEVENAELGDIVVFWRSKKTSWKGHVAFYIREDETHIWVLGGNQNNEVNIKPYLKSRLLGYRNIK